MSKTNLLEVLKSWCEINSWSHNPEGIEACFKLMDESFAPLADHTYVDHGTGIVRYTKFEDRKKSILFSCHVDTVFPPGSGFLTCREEGGKLFGPGVADAKGGIAVMLGVLQTLDSDFENSDYGWEVILNSDEEIGSLRSKDLLMKHAKQHTLACVFEPRLPNGNVVSNRAGSLVMKLVSEGKASHAGRHFHEGKNAILPLSKVLVALTIPEWLGPDAVFNVGTITGGKAANVVPGSAECIINIRAKTHEEIQVYLAHLKTAIDSVKDGKFTLTELTYRPPKPLTPMLQESLTQLQAIAEDLTIPFNTEPTNGVCDGNFIAQADIPVIDTLGVKGNYLHTHNEEMIISSLEECVRLNSQWLRTKLIST